MHLSPAHVGLHRAVREPVNADSLLPGLGHSIPTRCSSVPHLSVIVNRLSANAQYYRPPSSWFLHTVHSGPDRSTDRGVIPGLGLAALAHSYLARSSIHLSSACPSPIYQKQLFLWRSSSNEPHFSCVPPHDPRACAVDGNHHCPALLCPGCTFSVVGRREVVRERIPHRLFSVLEGSLLTSEQGPISLLTLRSQSALPLNEGTLCVLGRNNASIYVFRRSGTRPWLHGLAVQRGAESPKNNFNNKWPTLPPGPYFRYNVGAQIYSPLVFRPACGHVVQSGAVAACQPLAAHGRNRLQSPCCGSMDMRARCLARVSISGRDLTPALQTSSAYVCICNTYLPTRTGFFVTNTSTISTLSYPDVLGFLAW